MTGHVRILHSIIYLDMYYTIYSKEERKEEEGRVNIIDNIGVTKI